MKKLIVMIVLYLFIVGCSTPEERYDIANHIVDEIVYQRYSDTPDSSDFIIGYTNKELYVILISANGRIKKITKIPREELFKGDL